MRWVLAAVVIATAATADATPRGRTIVGEAAGPVMQGDTVVYRYEAAGLCLECDTYTITLPTDGHGTVVFDARWRRPARTRSFVATRKEVRAFRNTIDRYRPPPGA